MIIRRSRFLFIKGTREKFNLRLVSEIKSIRMLNFFWSLKIHKLRVYVWWDRVKIKELESEWNFIKFKVKEWIKW